MYIQKWIEFANNSWKQMLRELKEAKENGVYLSTFHGAKGLQWDSVIIISVKEGTTPLIRKGSIENPEEERRLFYVAMTRAKNDLYFFVPVSKGNNPTRPSKYLNEMNSY